MQHTTKYQFNLIETSDTFSPEALNQNAQAAERELAALEKTAANHKAELEAADSALAAALDSRVGIHGQTCRVATGSYEGNGLSDLGLVPSIAVDFKPLAVFVGSDAYSAHAIALFRPFHGSIPKYSNSLAVTWEDRKVSWLAMDDEVDMLNMQGTTYHYVVLGVDE